MAAKRNSIQAFPATSTQMSPQSKVMKQMIKEFHDAGIKVVMDVGLATLLIGLAAAAHQGFAANLFTLVSDTAPRRVVSSIVGIGGAAAAVAGMFAAKATGYVLEWTASYVLLFAGASIAYLLALLVIHLINPRHEPMRLKPLGTRK